MLFHSCLLVVAALVLTEALPKDEQDLGFEKFFEDNTGEYDNIKLRADKAFPSWIRGTYIRNGLGRFHFGKRRVLHVLDGYAKLTKFNFSDGEIYYSSKFVKSKFYMDSVKKKDVAPYLLFQGVEPRFNIFEKFETFVNGLDNMNVNVHRFNKDDFVVENDFWRIYQFDIESLNVTRRITPPVPNVGIVDNFLSLISSAHPMPEAHTGNHLNFVTTIQIDPEHFGKGFISFCRVLSSTSREVIARWSLDKVPYMHSFAATENHALLFGGPLFINVPNIIKYGAPLYSLEWHGDKVSQLFVVDLKSGTLRKTTGVSDFMMHHINSFEENGTIIVDAVSYPDIDFLKSLQVSILRNKTARDAAVPSSSKLVRHVLDLSTMKLSTKEHNFTPGLEFVNKLDLPTVNEEYRYRKYCFVYGNVIKSDGINVANVTLVKKDLCATGTDRFWYEPYQYPTEAWYVPRPGGYREDDGALLTIVLDGYKETSYLLVVDAMTMKTVTKLYLPSHVPYSIHGRFFY